MARKSSDETALPMNPRTFMILLAFAEAPAHGYEIRKRAEALSENTIKLDAGSLYRSIAHLLDIGLIEEEDPKSEVEITDARRRYYALTARGRELVAAEAQRLAGLVEHAALSGLIRTPKAAH